MGRCGKADDECGSLPVGVVMAENLTSVLLHNAVADAQAEAGSLANLFGGEEGIEDAIGVGDTVAIVAEGNFDGIVGLGGHDFDTSGAADFVHGVIGVVQDVQKNLLQLVSVTDNVGKIFVEVFDDVDAVAVEVVGTQLNRPAQDKVELHGVTLRRHLPGKTEQILHDGLGALGFLQNDAKVFTGSLGNLGVFKKEIGKAEDCGQWIVDFVGNAGDELSDGGHFFGVNEFVAQFGASR